MKKQSNCIDKRLENWINNKLFTIFNKLDFEIETIFYIYRDEKDSNF